MLSDPSPRDAERCISDLRLHALHAGELERKHELKLAAHIAACSRCRSRDERIRDEARRYLDAPECVANYEAVLCRRQAAARKQRWRSAVLVLSAAAVALMALVGAPEQEVPAYQVKGGLNFGYFVKRGELVFRGAQDQRLWPGDQLRFTILPATSGFLTILSRDETGAVNVYYPADGAPPSRIAPSGEEIALGAATELDAQLGSELIYGIYCQRPERVELRVHELSSRGQLVAKAGCAIERLRVTKERPVP